MRREIVGMRRTLVLVVSLGLVIALAIGIPVLAASMYEHYNTGDDGAGGAYGSLWAAQTFTPSAAHTITSVKLKLYRTGPLGPGIVTVGIRATSGGQPSGGDLCFGTINGNTLTTSYAGAWYQITLGGGYGLSAATQYAIVVRAPGGDMANHVGWMGDYTTPTYGGGMYLISLDNGSSWISPANADFMFEEWGDPAVVGWETYHIDKIRVVTPWIVLAVVLAGGTGWYIFRRRTVKG